MKVLLAKGSGFSSWLVRVVTRSPYTHAALVFPSGEVLHSSIGGVQMTDMNYINSHYTNVTQFECRFNVAEDAAKRIMHKTIGMKYDYWSFIGLGISILFGLKKNPLGRHSQLMCSEVPAWWLNRCQELDQSLLIRYFDPEMTTPALLWEYFGLRPDLFEPL
jgi:hypothetical protein